MKNKLTSINRSFFIILISLLSLFTNFLLYYILSFGGFTINKNSLFEYDLIYIFIFGVIVAPILETILFQFTFYKGLNFCIKMWFEKFNLRKENILAVSLLGTSFFFAMCHFFDFGYFILMFVFGSVLSMTFYFSELRNENPIINTTMVHAFYNLALILMSIIIN